jgi:hypothetical protein
LGAAGGTGARAGGGVCSPSPAGCSLAGGGGAGGVTGATGATGVTGSAGGGGGGGAGGSTGVTEAGVRKPVRRSALLRRSQRAALASLTFITVPLAIF